MDIKDKEEQLKRYKNQVEMNNKISNKYKEKIEKYEKEIQNYESIKKQLEDRKNKLNGVIITNNEEIEEKNNIIVRIIITYLNLLN